MCFYEGVREIERIKEEGGGWARRRVKSYSVLPIPLVSCSHVSCNKSVLQSDIVM